MEFHSMTFFAGKENISHGPKVNISYETQPTIWPITLHLNSEEPPKYGTSIHLRNESQLIQFVNSVKWSYDKYRKGQGYDR